MKKSNEKKKKAAPSSIKSLVVPLITSFLSGMIVFFVCLSLSSALVVNQNMAFDKMSMLLMVSCILSAVVAGFVLSRNMQVKGLVAGVLAALPLMLVEILIIISMSDGHVSGTVYLLIPTMLVAGAVGGVSAVNMKPKKRKK
ncbi:MAG: TIGR04086 family membrane protein [Oscillospiraceae bacterium]|jgi:putative membrane protein (TIGR04086 family)|nr:TIGR04086 family membrane protein [Oscillospiraceae bacterium]